MKRLIVVLLLLAGFRMAVSAATGLAEIKGTAPNSPISGTVYFQDVPNGLKINAMLVGVPPGPHGFHIHEFGNCADAGKAAGSHYNPMSTPHGQITKEGMGHAHAGDLGNITAGPDGQAALEALIPGLALTGNAVSAAGRAVILHEKVDDFSQPVGNAGGRIGCGPIVLYEPPAPPASPSAPSK